MYILRKPFTTRYIIIDHGTHFCLIIIWLILCIMYMWMYAGLAFYVPSGLCMLLLLFELNAKFTFQLNRSLLIFFLADSLLCWGLIKDLPGRLEKGKMSNHCNDTDFSRLEAKLNANILYQNMLDDLLIKLNSMSLSSHDYTVNF